MASSESYTPCLIGAMDRLWFHKIVLFSEPICSSKSLVAMMNPPSSSSSSSSSSSDSQPSSNSSSASTDGSDDDTTEEFSQAAHELLPTISNNPENESEVEDDKKETVEEEGEDNTKGLTPTRRNLVMKKTKSSSSATRRVIKTRLKLERTKSCKSLTELEQEEVKGFMDLGFIFDKDRLTPRMMSVIPGLQRLAGRDEDDETDEDGHEEEEEDMKVVGEAKRRPYLSEAWLIKRPDSPLLRLRISRVSTTSSDMKKHLKLWAKTVAYSAVQHS